MAQPYVRPHGTDTQTQPDTEDVADRPGKRSLTKAYEARPPHQRNDYLGWITRAKLPATREKRLAQMSTSWKPVACT